MKKHYSILWIDDDEDSIRTSKKDIAQYLSEKGIIAKIVYSNPYNWTSNSEYDENVKNCLDNPELDIVLMDYNLGDTFGKDIIIQLRTDNNLFLPIIYYSQQHYDDLKNSLTEENVDGVFVTHRNKLEERTKNILDSLLKKENKVRRMRGLLLSDTSEFEALGADIANRCWNFLTDEQKNTVREKVKEYCEKSVKSQKKNITKLINSEYDNINIVWKERCLDSSKRGYLFKKILEQLNWEEHKINIKTLCQDNSNPIENKHIYPFSERNRFAHQTEIDLQRRIDGSSEIDFPKELRNELHKVEENIEKLMSDIEKRENE